jgi:hypothetical protein
MFRSEWIIIRQFSYNTSVIIKLYPNVNPYSVQNILSFRLLSKHVKIEIYKTIVLSSSIIKQSTQEFIKLINQY